MKGNMSACREDQGGRHQRRWRADRRGARHRRDHDVRQDGHQQGWHVTKAEYQAGHKAMMKKHKERRRRSRPSSNEVQRRQRRSLRVVGNRVAPGPSRINPSALNDPGGVTMTLRIGDTAPDFEAQTTEGPIKFHDWVGNSWAVLFSHPKDFTPVCTTELGYMARLKPEFDKRNVKVIGLSVDPVDQHAKWADDIKETQGHAPNYPMIGDPELKVAKAWGMLPAELLGILAGPHARGQPDRAQRVRRRAGQEDQADPGLPDDHRPQLRRGAAGDRFAAAHRQAQGVDAGELETGRRRDHRRLGQRRRRQEDVSRTAGSRPKPYIRIVPQPK